MLLSCPHVSLPISFRSPLKCHLTRALPCPPCITQHRHSCSIFPLSVNLHLTCTTTAYSYCQPCPSLPRTEQCSMGWLWVPHSGGPSREPAMGSQADSLWLLHIQHQHRKDIRPKVSQAARSNADQRWSLDPGLSARGRRPIGLAKTSSELPRPEAAATQSLSPLSFHSHFLCTPALPSLCPFPGNSPSKSPARMIILASAPWTKQALNKYYVNEWTSRKRAEERTCPLCCKDRSLDACSRPLSHSFTAYKMKITSPLSRAVKRVN